MRLNRLIAEPLVRAALLEDLGRAGDITTDACVPDGVLADGILMAREAGVVAGLDLAAIAFELVEPGLRFSPETIDGNRVGAGQIIANIVGPARGLLTAERVALNFLGHMSGIATATRRIADAIAHTPCRVVCTRKTTPGLRVAEKYAVRCGGGANHRFGLDDAILIKDNHIALAGGIRAAVSRARAHAGHLVKIEVEVDTLEQLEELLAIGVDAVLLDNMSPEMLREAVRMVNGRAWMEASGRITAETAAAVAETGVNLISVGALTHSVRTLDIGLDI